MVQPVFQSGRKVDEDPAQVTGYLFFYYETTPQAAYLQSSACIQPDIDTWLNTYQGSASSAMITNLYKTRGLGKTDEAPVSIQARPEWGLLERIQNPHAFFDCLRYYTPHVTYRKDAGDTYSATDTQKPWHLSRVLTIQNAVALMDRESLLLDYTGFKMAKERVAKLFLMSADPHLSYSIVDDKYVVTKDALTSNEFKSVSRNNIEYIYRRDPPPEDEHDPEDTKDGSISEETREKMRSCIRPFSKCFELSYSAVHPINVHFMNLAMPHIREQITCSGKLFSEWRKGFISNFRENNDGVSPTDDEVKTAFREYYKSTNGGNLATNFIFYLWSIRDATDSSDPASRAAAFGRFNVLMDPAAPVGDTYRAIMRYIQGLHAINPRDHLESFFGMTSDDGLTGLVSRWAGFTCEVAESALGFNNLHREFMLVQTILDGASIPWPARTQLTAVLFGPTTTGKSRLCNIVRSMRIDGSGSQPAYATDKARYGTGNAFGDEIMMDDIPGAQMGVPDLVQSYWAKFRLASGQQTAPNTPGLAALKAELTNIFQRVVTAGVSKDTQRINFVSDSVKAASRIWNTNTDPRWADRALIARILMIYIGQYGRKDFRDPASSLLQETDATSHPLAVNYANHVRRRQAIIVLWNMLSMSGAMPAPSIKWAATWLDVLLRVYEALLGFKVRALRHLNYMQQLAHTLSMHAAITAYDMGLAERPDLDQNFNLTDLDGLAAYGVAGLDSAVFLIELMGGLVDPQLFQTCTMLRRFQRWYARETQRDGNRVRPMRVENDYYIFPDLCVAMKREPQKNFREHQALYLIVTKLMEINPDGSGSSVMNEDSYIAVIGGLSCVCVIAEGAQEPRYRGLVFRDDGEIHIHRRVMEIGMASDDPVERSILSCIPHDWPEGQRVCRGRWDPNTTEFMKIELKQNYTLHPEVRHLFKQMLRKTGQLPADKTDPIPYEEIPAYLASDDSAYAEFQKNANNFKTVRVSNQCYIDGKQVKNFRAAAPGAARKIAEEGRLRQSATTDVTYASYLQSYRDHLTSLGVKDPERHAAYPPNLERCTKAYAKMCDAMSEFQKRLLGVRKAFTIGLHETDRAAYLLAVEQMEDRLFVAAFALIDMFMIFRYFKNYDRWQVHGPKTLKVQVLNEEGVETQVTIELKDGIRMSETNVVSYLHAYFPDFEEIGRLPNTLRTMAWIMMQNKYSETCAVPIAWKKDGVMGSMLKWLMSEWLQKTLPSLKPLDGPSLADPLVFSNRRVRSSGRRDENPDDLPPEDEEQKATDDVKYASKGLYDHDVRMEEEDLAFELKRREEEEEEGDAAEELLREIEKIDASVSNPVDASDEEMEGKDEEEEGEEEKKKEDEEEEEEAEKKKEEEEEKEEEEKKQEGPVIDESTQMPDSANDDSNEAHSARIRKRLRKVAIEDSPPRPKKRKAKPKRQKKNKFVIDAAELSDDAGPAGSDENEEGKSGGEDIDGLVASGSESDDDEATYARMSLFREQSENSMDPDCTDLRSVINRLKRPGAPPVPPPPPPVRKAGFTLFNHRNNSAS